MLTRQDFNGKPFMGKIIYVDYKADDKKDKKKLSITPATLTPQVVSEMFNNAQTVDIIMRQMQALLMSNPFMMMKFIGMFPMGMFPTPNMPPGFMTSPDQMSSPLAPGRLGPPNNPYDDSFKKMDAPAGMPSPMVNRVQQFINQQYGESSGGGPMRNNKFSSSNRFNPMMSPALTGTNVMSSINNNQIDPKNANVIFVYGLQPEMKNDELEKMFAPFGVILSCTVSQGKGYGFVHFETNDQACHAVRCMNEFPHKGKKLQVSIKVKNYNK